MTRIRFVELDGVRIATSERGAGAPLVLLHGFTGSARDLAPLAAVLSARHRVVCIDLVGHGCSDAPRDDGAYTLERCVAQVAGAIELLGASPAHVFGYSMGGRAALALAAWRPHLVRSLALLGASAGLADPVQRAARRANDEALAARIERDGVSAFARAWARLPLFATQRTRISDCERDAIHDRRLANRAHGLAGSLRGMGTGAQPPLLGVLARVAVPVWLAHGADDEKFAGIARHLAGRLPRARLCAIPRAGHAAHLENRDAVAAQLTSFLADVERTPRSPRPPGAPRAAQGGRS